MNKIGVIVGIAMVLGAVSFNAAAQTRGVLEGQFGKITVTSSSTLAPQAGNSYAPINAIDGDGRTAWIEGASGDGIGEWLKVSYDAPKKIRSIYIANGYGKSTKSYRSNSRIREAEIATENGSFLPVLRDENDEIKITMPANMAGTPTRWVKITIKSVYPGTVYKDTALGEFRPDLEENNYE